MDPDSSTFCVNYLSQFPLIKEETINILCFNGFTNYHQLSQLDVDSDLPCIRDISVEQKAAVKRALVRFASQANDVTTSTNNDDSTTLPSSTSTSTIINYQQFSNDRAAASPGATDRTLTSLSTASNDNQMLKSSLTTTSCHTLPNQQHTQQNSFYLDEPIQPSVVDAATALQSLDEINIENDQNYVTQSKSVRSLTNQSARVTDATALNVPASSSSSTSATTNNISRASNCLTDVVSATVTASAAIVAPNTNQLILLAGKNSNIHSNNNISGGGGSKNNKSSTSSIYQRIDQSNLPGQSSSSSGSGGGNLKLGEAGANNCSANSNASPVDVTTPPHSEGSTSLPSPSSKGQKPSETSVAAGTVASEHSVLNVVVSTSSSVDTKVVNNYECTVSTSQESITQSNQTEAAKTDISQTSSDYNNFINKKFRRTPQSFKDSSISSECNLQIENDNLKTQSNNIDSSTGQDQSKNECTTKDEESELIIDTSEASSKQSPYSSSPSSPNPPANNQGTDCTKLSTATRMPYTIFEQLDCAKKLENGEKPLLSYHCGSQDNSVQDIKKDNLINSISGSNGDTQGAVDGRYSLSSLSANTINRNNSNGGNPNTTTSLPISVSASSNLSNVHLILSYSNGNPASTNTSVAVANSNENNVAGTGTVTTTINDSVINGGNENSAVVSSVTDTNNQQQQQQQMQQQPSNSSTQFVNALQLPTNGGNMVVSSIAPSLLVNSTTSSNLATISAAATTNNQNNNQMQIRDYLSEINVLQPASTNGSVVNDIVSLQQQANNNNNTNTILTNSVTNFLSAHDHQQLMKNGSILVDQNGHPIDPNFNQNYLYGTVQLQLAPTGDVQRSLDAAAKAQTSPLFTLGAANIVQQQQQPQHQQQQQQQQQQPQQSNLNQVTTTTSASSPSPQTHSPRRGRGRPKKYTDPLSLAVEQCLENSNSPTQATTPVNASITQFGGSPNTPTIHRCRWPGCHFQSGDVLEFRNHNRTEHRDESTIIPPRKGKASALKEPLMCEVPGCGYSPKYRRLLIDHQNAHKGLRAHKCCFCEYNSSYFGDIRKHMIKKHPELAQEIKTCKLKLKQNGLDGKSSKLSKAEIDELSHKMATEAVKAKRGSPGEDDLGKRRSYKRKRVKKEDKTVDQSVNQQLSTVSTSQAYAAITASDPKATLSLSNLALQQGQNQQPQYSFMTAAPGHYGLQVAGTQSDINQSGLATANYGTLNAANLMGQTIIYVQASPNSGNTVQLTNPNDMSALNQIIGYTDLNGQLTMTTGHAQSFQNLGASTFAQQTRTLHDSNSLAGICLDGNGNTQQGTTLAFVTDPQAHHNNQASGQTATGAIYKCDSSLCYFQTDQFDQLLIHKHNEHSMQHQPQQQQIAIIDASTLAAMQASNSQQPHVSQQSQDHQHHSSIYALTPTSTATSSANFVHTSLDYASLASATATVMNGGIVNNSNGSNNSTNNVGDGNLNQAGSVTNMIFTSDPNALYFNTASIDHSGSNTLDRNGLVTVTSNISTVSSTPSTATSLVAAAVASAGLTDTSTVAISSA